MDGCWWQQSLSEMPWWWRRLQASCVILLELWVTPLALPLVPGHIGWHHRAPLIQEELFSTAADVVALQEVDPGRWGSYACRYCRCKPIMLQQVSPAVIINYLGWLGAFHWTGSLCTSYAFCWLADLNLLISLTIRYPPQMGGDMQLASRLWFFAAGMLKHGHDQISLFVPVLRDSAYDYWWRHIVYTTN